MQNVARKNPAKRPVVFPLVICIIAAEIITALIAVIISAFIVNIDDYENIVIISSYICSGAGAFIGGLLTSMAFRRDKYAMSLACGIIICIILVIINLIFYREPVSSLSFIKYGVIIFSSFIASFFVRRRRRVRRKIS